MKEIERRGERNKGEIPNKRPCASVSRMELSKYLSKAH
jgi:hypothetical protein